MRDYLKKEVIHTAFAVFITVLVAVAADLVDISSFDDVTLAGLAVTAVRSGSTAIVALLSRYIAK